MELTKEQIDGLYTFTQKHYVEFYDVQTELVDHLANDIEHIWKGEPHLTFHQARDKSFKKFGIFGFSEVVEQKQKELNKKYWKLTWKFFKQYFTFPKIMLTLFLTAFTYLIIDITTNKELLVKICFVSWVIIPIIIVIKNVLRFKKRRKQTKKKWLYENIVSSLGGFAYLTQIPIQLFNFKHSFNFNLINQIVFTIFIALTSILIFVMVYVTPKKMEEKISKQYPEYNLYKKA